MGSVNKIDRIQVGEVEIRALTGWLLEEGCPAVARWGFSFGGWLAALPAGNHAAPAVFDPDMKAMKVLSIVIWVCVVATASYWLGYQRGSRSRSPNPPSLQASRAESWEHKTHITTNDLRWEMQRLQQEGWLVLSWSAPTTQADGTIVRRMELKRARK